LQAILFASKVHLVLMYKSEKMGTRQEKKTSLKGNVWTTSSFQLHLFVLIMLSVRVNKIRLSRSSFHTKQMPSRNKKTGKKGKRFADVFRTLLKWRRKTV